MHGQVALPQFKAGKILLWSKAFQPWLSLHYLFFFFKALSFFYGQRVYGCLLILTNSLKSLRWFTSNLLGHYLCVCARVMDIRCVTSVFLWPLQVSAQLEVCRRYCSNSGGPRNRTLTTHRQSGKIIQRA